MDAKNIAGISMKGGRRDNFYLCLLEFYGDQNRWFLRSLLKVKDAGEDSEESGGVIKHGLTGDEVIRSWVEKHNLHHLVVDIPLSYPTHHQQSLDRLEQEKKYVKEVQAKIKELLKADQDLSTKNPKAYEIKRNNDDLIDFSEDITKKDSHEHILSRSFKRRLRKGFLPYWNRTVDLWVWMYYYDQLLDLFNISFDSFGNTSLMNLFRFDYLRTYLPEDLKLYEGNFQILLIELLKSKIILKKDIVNLSDLDLCVEARLDIIKKIEKKLNVFIYDHDLEVLVKNPRAFESFMMAVVGQNIHLSKTKELPAWTMPEHCFFTVPYFD